MEHVFHRMGDDFLGRVGGPLTFRLVLQPMIAAILAIRSGLRDAREGHTPFAWALAAEPAQRRDLLRQLWTDAGKVFLLATILDVIYQLLVIHWVYPGETLIVASVLALVPYLIVRGFTNRIAHYLHPRAPIMEPSHLPAPDPAQRHRLRKRIVAGVAGFLLVWLVMAYLLLPSLWKHYARKHPGLEDIPGITHTGTGIPGDPLNVALIGTKAEVMKIMVAAKWYPADPLTLKSCLEIAEATVLKRPYDEAPVSNLYLFGRKEDLAFEQPVGKDPRKRHHVRFWKTDSVDTDGRPVWVGSAVYDEHVGFSKTTGQITHVTAADVDAERDYLFHDLEKTGDLAETYSIDGFHKILKGKNGGGDPWYTDGRLFVGVIRPTPSP